MVQLLSRLQRDESGATAIEYGLIAMGIFLAIIVSVSMIGSALVSIFTQVNNGFPT
ncbi:MAG: Flp family type IVb pilin [Hyphomicrobiaceae bacterium]